MDKIKFVKRVVSTIVGIGTTKIVSAIIENNVDTDTLTSKVTVTAASTAIGYAAADNLSEYTDSKIEEAVAWWKERQTKKEAE